MSMYFQTFLVKLLSTCGTWTIDCIIAFTTQDFITVLTLDPVDLNVAQTNCAGEVVYQNLLNTFGLKNNQIKHIFIDVFVRNEGLYIKVFLSVDAFESDCVI